jgi:hypothetical protein
LGRFPSQVFRADIDRDIAPGEYVNDSQFAALHRTRPTTISIRSGSRARCAGRHCSWPASRLAMFATRPHGSGRRLLEVILGACSSLGRSFEQSSTSAIELLLDPKQLPELL